MIIQSMGLGKEDEEEKLLGHREGLLEGSGCFCLLYSDIGSSWPLKNKMESYWNVYFKTEAWLQGFDSSFHS